jgi:transposase-like protein
MVDAVNAGTPIRAVARQFGVSRPTVERWVARAAKRRLDRVDWNDGSSSPHRIHRTPPEIEAQVLALRRDLRERSALGEYGAIAIHREWPGATWGPPPAVRTIGRVLERCGALDGQHRVRRPAPPRGWYLPAVARGTADCDCFDVIEGLVLQGGPEVEVLTGLALHAGLPDAWPGVGVTTAGVLRALQGRWRGLGLPAFAQFDNDTCFQGAHHFPDVVGRIVRLCLQLGCVPVFTPLKDPSFQAALENFNGRWQTKVWHRFHHASLPVLQARSRAYITAARQRGSTRAADAPPRRPFPADWEFAPSVPPRGRLIYLRRTTADGAVTLLGHTFPVDRHWVHRLIRAEVTLPGGPIRFFRLRRRDPENQPLLREAHYELPERRRSLKGWH